MTETQWVMHMSCRRTVYSARGWCYTAGYWYGVLIYEVLNGSIKAMAFAPLPVEETQALGFPPACCPYRGDELVDTVGCHAVEVREVELQVDLVVEHVLAERAAEHGLD